MEDSVLKFAVMCSLSPPGDYCGYHLLHYFLSYALQRTLTVNALPTYQNHPNPYDFSIACLKWKDQEANAEIPQYYTDQYFYDYYLQLLPSKLFPVVLTLLQQVTDSCLTKTTLPLSLHITALLDTLTLFACPKATYFPLPHVHIY